VIYIVTALPWEARPIIDRYNLRREGDPRYFPVFSGNDMRLIVSGVGKIASSIAATYLLAGEETGQDTAIVNIGLCGAVNQEHPIGTSVLVNKIVDHETGNEYYPDILLKHPFIEGSIETHSRVVRRENVDGGQTRILADYVDMEASGFYQAAVRFLSPHQIYVIKIISDYLDVKDFHKDRVTGWIARAVDDIYGFLEQVRMFCKSNEPVFSEAEQCYLENIKERLRLTVTQGHQLVDLARKYKIRTGKPLPDFSDVIGIEVKVKAEGRKAFEGIKRILTAE